MHARPVVIPPLSSSAAEQALRAEIAKTFPADRLPDLDRKLFSPLFECPSLLPLPQARRLTDDFEMAIYFATDKAPQAIRFLGLPDRDDVRNQRPVVHGIGAELFDSHGAFIARALNIPLTSVLAGSTTLTPRHVLIWYYLKLSRTRDIRRAENLRPLMELAPKALPLGRGPEKVRPVWYIQTLG